MNSPLLKLPNIPKSVNISYNRSPLPDTIPDNNMIVNIDLYKAVAEKNIKIRNNVLQLDLNEFNQTCPLQINSRPNSIMILTLNKDLKKENYIKLTQEEYVNMNMLPKTLQNEIRKHIIIDKLKK